MWIDGCLSEYPGDAAGKAPNTSVSIVLDLDLLSYMNYNYIYF